MKKEKERTAAAATAALAQSVLQCGAFMCRFLRVFVHVCFACLPACWSAV